MATSSLPRRRYVYKHLKAALALPDPMRSEDSFLMFANKDLRNMDLLRLRCERDRARLMLLLQADDDAIIAISTDGRPITAKAWLSRRLALIEQALRGAV